MNRTNIIALFERDIRKLRTEMEAYPTNESIWLRLPGTINSGGNLCQHLIGNLRTYVGLTLGKYDYVRDRDAEFEKQYFTRPQLISELDELLKIVTLSIQNLPEAKLADAYPREVLDMFPEQSTSKILEHLLTHLSYHLGQINYHRRWVTATQVSVNPDLSVL